jgi:hypothetical protein
MVTVEMGNKDVVETRKFEPRATHLQLGSFATINHVEFVAHVDHL